MILLDTNLPDEDGFSRLREIRRQSEVGVIMATGKDEDIDRIVALALGAGDNVVNPFNTRELFARTKNLLRRTLTSPTGTNVRLTRFEFELLATLSKTPGRVLSHDSLIDHVSGCDRASNDRTVDVLIGRLRRKMELTPNDPRLIVTVQGVRYVLAV